MISLRKILVSRDAIDRGRLRQENFSKKKREVSEASVAEQTEGQTLTTINVG